MYLTKAEYPDTALNSEGRDQTKICIMKTIIQILLLSLTMLACSKSSNDSLQSEKKPEQVVKNARGISYTISSRSPFRISSDQLKEVDLVLNGKQTYGYILKDPEDSNSLVSSLAEPSCGTMTTGYFFCGNCLVYGTLHISCSGVYLFHPCGFNCIGFDDICPPPGGGIARTIK